MQSTTHHHKGARIYIFFPQREPALYYRRKPLKYGLQESPSSDVLSNLAQGRVSQWALGANETSPILRHATCYDKDNTRPMQKKENELHARTSDKENSS